MRSGNSGSIFFYIFIAMMLNGMGLPFGILIPIFIFFSIASSMNKQQQSQRKRGHVRESTRRRRAEQTRTETRRAPKSRRQVQNRPLITRNPFKKSGVDKYKDYDYDGAIEDFTKALQIEDRDTAVHFNLACAYSLTEQKDLAFSHLSKAVRLGFNDAEKIKTHDALAYLRIQEEFEQFEAGGYSWPLRGNTKKTTIPVLERPDLLQQLNQLKELKAKGLLTEAEFEVQRKKLLR